MKFTKNDLTIDYLKMILDYDPETGIFIWKERPNEHFRNVSLCKMWNIRHAKKIAGTPDRKGYLITKINSTRFALHRLAWFYVYERWPENGFIDHKNGNTSDNRIENLRDVTHTQNCQNQRMKRNSYSGFKGVHKYKKKWIAQIQVNGEKIYLGVFNSPEQAHASYVKAAKEHFGEFACY